MRQFNFKHTQFNNYFPSLALLLRLILSGTVYVTFSLYQILKKIFEARSVSTELLILLKFIELAQDT